MAKLKSLLKIEGTLGGITFYKTQDGNLAREKGGASREKIMHDPRFARTRENMQEFRTAAKAGKLLREAIRPLLITARDSRVTSRLTQVMSRIAKEDKMSLRGMRLPALGLSSADGKALLKTFDFNNAAPLRNILYKPYTLNSTTGEVTIANLIPVNDLAIPEGATHINFSGGMLNIDFATGSYDLQLTNVQNIVIDLTPISISLIPIAIPSSTGEKMSFLKIEFFQEVNANQYPLRSGAHNSLSVIYDSEAEGRKPIVLNQKSSVGSE